MYEATFFKFTFCTFVDGKFQSLENRLDKMNRIQLIFKRFHQVSREI